MSTTVLLGGHRLGIRNGRIDPVNWTPPGGDYALVFGSDIPGDQDLVSVGDSSTIKQDVNVTGVNLLTFAVKFRQGGDGVNVAFQLRVTIGGVTRYTLKPAAGVTVDYDKRTVFTGDLNGLQTLRWIVEAVVP